MTRSDFRHGLLRLGGPCRPLRWRELVPLTYAAEVVGEERIVPLLP